MQFSDKQFNPTEKSSSNYLKEDVLICEIEKEKRRKLIRKAKFSNKISRIVVEDRSGMTELKSQILDSTLNHILLNDGRNIPKKSVLEIEILN